MSVVIKMDMPNCCAECSFRFSYGQCWQNEFGFMCAARMGEKLKVNLSTGKDDDCPILCELPKKHGKLIDLDEFLSKIGLEDNEENREDNVGEIVTLEDFDNLTTIIEAEGEHENSI